MAGEGRLHRDPRCLRVAHLADEDDVGILPEDGAQAGGEGEARAGVHLTLRHSIELDLDGIFERDDVDVARVDQLKQGVQGRRLAGARRPARHDETLRSADDVAQRRLPDGLDSQAFERRQLLSGQDAKHELLALRSGERRRAQVDPLAPLEVDRDLPVLGQAALRDVHLREHLHARDDVRRDGERDGLHVDEGPVDAQAHLHHVVLRLEMNVTRPLRDRESHELVDQNDGIARHGYEARRGHRAPSLQVVAPRRGERAATPDRPPEERGKQKDQEDQVRQAKLGEGEAEYPTSSGISLLGRSGGI